MTQPPERTPSRRLSIHHPKFFLAAAVLLAGLGLTACAQQSGTPAAAPGKVAAPAPAKPAAAALAVPRSVPQSVPRSVPRSVPPATPRSVPLAVPLAPKVYPPPSHLAGLYGEQVIGLLGPPGFKRKDDPAQIWQYRTKVCALDLFLYRTEDGSPYRVRHFEARSRGKETVSARDCFVGLLKAHEQNRQG